MGKLIAAATSVLLMALWGLFPATAAAQGDLVDDMLRLPTGPKREAPQQNARPNRKAPPPDDAPLDVLVRFWAPSEIALTSMQIRGESLPTPSDKTRERLMEAVIADPQKAPSLLKLLPSTPAGHDRLKRLYDENVRLGETWSERVRRFRRQNSAYFRDDLYVHLTRNSARRVYMNNPGLIETDTIYEKLVVEFRRLVR